MILQVNNLHVSYGGIKALSGVTIEVNKGEIISIIGANGAGKSTLLRTISGLIKPDYGNIIFDSQDITNMPPHKIAFMGISHVPEGRGIFYNLTVLENLQIATSALKAKKCRSKFRKSICSFSTPCRKKKTACWDPKWRRTTDACYRAKPCNGR